nr:hypothetical protein [uncultured Sulfurimonas sp.]
MKPLLAKDLPNFVNRFGNFIDAEIRSIEIISPTTMLASIACQDSARSFDWLTLKLEFSGVSDARLLESSKFSFIDMNDGISILNQENNFLFAIGKYDTISGIKNASTYIISSFIKYEEKSF